MSKGLIEEMTLVSVTELAALYEKARAADESLAEFNAGYEAYERGEPIEAEPYDAPYDVWCCGWAWAQYQKDELAELRARVAELEAKQNDEVCYRRGCNALAVGEFDIFAGDTRLGSAKLCAEHAAEETGKPETVYADGRIYPGIGGMDAKEADRSKYV